MKIFILIINILISSVGLFSQTSQMQLECENARIDEISGNEKTLIQKIRVKYPTNMYYLSRIDSGLYNITYKSNTHLYGILKGEELILPMIFEKNYEKVIENNKNRYLIVNQYSKAGLYDLQNQSWKVPLIYETMSKLDGGDLLIHIDRNAGVCDMEGKVILPCMYRRIEFNKHLGVYIVEDENSKIGIYDPKTSSWNISCKYSSISNFSSKIITVEKNDSIFLFSADKKLKYYENIEIDVENNLVLVKVGNEFRILNENSQEIFKKRFSELNYIGGYNDIIVKLKNNKYSLANIKHKTLMQYNYDNIEKLNNSFLVQKGNLYGIVEFVNGEYKEILPCVNNNILVEFNFFITENNNKYRLLNKEGKKVINSDYDDIRICSYKNKSFKGVGEFANLSNDKYTQLAIVGTKDRYNVYDIKGTKIIEKDYQAILPLISSELAHKKALHQLCLGFITKEKGSFGIIDLSGNTILSSEYSEIRHLNKGLMQIGKNNKYAVFDYFNKKFLTEFKYEQLMSYEESCIGIIDNEYYEISVYQNFKQEKLLTQSIEKKLNFHVLTKNISDKNTNILFGSEVEPTKLDYECMSRIMGHYNNPKNTYTLVRNGLYYAESSDKKGAYFDTIGMLTPFATDHNIDIRLSQKLKNDLFPIELLSRYGLFDLKKRKFKILPKYENFKIIEDGRFFVVSIDNHYKILDENDETIIDLGYLHAKPVYSNNSLIMKNMLGQYGIINLKNRQVKVNFEYDYIEPYANHRIAFAKKNNKYKLISYDNELLSDILVDKVENLYIENLVLIQLGKDYSILDTKEMKVIPLAFSANSFHTQADVLNIFLKSDIKDKDLNTLKSSLNKLDSYKFIKKHYTYFNEKQYFNTLNNNKYKLSEVGQNFHIKEVIQYENGNCEYNDKINGFIIKQNGKFGVVKADGSVKANPIFDKIYATKYGNILGAFKNNLYIIPDKSSDTTNLKIKDFSIVYEHSLKETFYTTKGEIYLIKGKDTFGKTMLYDTYGKAILDTSYDEITHLGDSYFVIKDKESVGLLNTKNKPKVEMQIEYKNIFYADKKFYGVDQDKIIKSFTPYNF